ncbi:MAG: hypothetical protein NTW47_22990, partial [Proteobacteria bacterium]|nr:hypothetical protein [Pseudomonadota bacterium]
LSSLCVWAAVAWKTTFRPAQLVGLLSSLAIFRLKKSDSEALSDVVLVPLIWIRNLGARPAVVEDVRLTFTGGGMRLFSYPGYTFTKETALSKELDWTLDGKREIFPHEDLFSGFALSANEYWIKSYAFVFRDRGDLEKLAGMVGIEIEIRLQKEARWRQVFLDRIDFGRAPGHLLPFAGRRTGSYYYPCKRYLLRDHYQDPS